MVTDIRAAMAIAGRDVTKLFRDKTRILASLIFPIVFIGALGGSLESNWGTKTGYNLMVFIFTGVLAQTLFQSTASGIISLVEDRVSDFSQEMFIAPVSRYTIILGKIVGETLVSMVQGVVVLIFGLIIGVPMGIQQFISLIPVAIVACLFGGAFGLIIMANLSSERTANQIFPFLLFPQFFLAGVFSPVKSLPIYLWALSRISPMTYAVDLARGVYYTGKPEYKEIVLHSPMINLVIIGLMFAIFLVVGTFLFVKNERNR